MTTPMTASATPARINLAEKLARFSAHYQPKIVGELNGQHVKLVKFQGEFVWHSHEAEDEMFLVLKGAFDMQFRDRTVRIGDAAFKEKYASLPVDFVTTNDITGGNSGSSTLNRNLEIVGLIFDGNEEAMAGDWAYSEVAGRALSTDIRFALTIARDVHGAGWIVEELTK